MSEYICLSCGIIEDRNLNAALNLTQYPRLVGNWGREARTPMDDHTSIRLAPVNRASVIVEVGTRPCVRRAQIREQMK